MQNIKAKLICLVVLALTISISSCNQNQFKSGNLNPGYQSQPYQWSDKDKQVALIVGVIYFIAICIGIFINCFLLYKCYQKRKTSRVIKEQMALKKMEFALSIGMNVNQLNNDQRIGGTIHV